MKLGKDRRTSLGDIKKFLKRKREVMEKGGGNQEEEEQASFKKSKKVKRLPVQGGKRGLVEETGGERERRYDRIGLGG